MATREEMLDRIRKALESPPGSPHSAPWSSDVLPGIGTIMPAIAPADLVSKFEEEIGKVSGSACRAASSGELDEILRKLLGKHQGKAVVLSRNPLLAQLDLPEKLRALGIATEVWAGNTLEATNPGQPRSFREQAFSAQVGITGIDFALAESGTLVLSSPTEGAQLASLAPPVHVALYRRSQLVASLEEVLERLRSLRDGSAPFPGRSVVFITGVSRTADIEQILIRGVHGPRELHAILVEDSCLES